MIYMVGCFISTCNLFLMYISGQLEQAQIEIVSHVANISSIEGRFLIGNYSSFSILVYGDYISLFIKI